MQNFSKNSYLVVKGSGGGGLGDRIRCVICGIAYAKLSKRVLFVDWGDGRLISDKRNVFCDLFTVINMPSINECPESNDVWPISWQGRLNDSLHQLYTETDPKGWDREKAVRQFSFNQSKIDHPNHTLVMWEFDHFNDLFAATGESSVMQFARNLAQEHLSADKNIARQVEQFKQQYFKPNMTMVGLHIRATNEFNVSKSSVLIEQYIAQVKQIKSRRNDQVLIYLATDNSDVTKIISQAFAGRVVVRDKWFAAPGEKIHFNESCPEMEAALNDACVEMLLLSECDYLIYQQNSSYGMCADIFSKAQDENIFPLFASKTLAQRIKSKIKRIIDN